MFAKPVTEIFPNPPEDIDAQALDESRVPQHIAVIMDGNGRWAKKRALNRLSGHKAGIEAVRELIRAANDIGVKHLTIYSFSTENWKRPLEEVTGLMNLFAKTMLAEVDELDKENVRVHTIGDMSALPDDTRKAFETAWNQTKDNTGMTLHVAVNYGSRNEMLHAMNLLINDAVAAVREGLDVPEVTEEAFASYLYTADVPDPELLIRTSGEMRISNFLLWQIAYSEIYVTDILWPDFNRYELLKAVLSYQARDRRFGGVK